jgi:pimeloyl-ACP methyl ester carboxylesterase
VGGRAQLHLKDLEVYAGDTPPADYSIDQEVTALERFADSIGLDRFHLVGYSGGGFISLAYAGKRPERLLSLALFEPAMVPGDMTAEERLLTDAFRSKLHGLAGAELMSAFVREQVRPGVELPPPPPTPPSSAMLKRPAGIVAMMPALFAYQFDRERFRACGFPVYLGYGDQTSEMEVVKAGILARLFGDIRVQRYPGIHHFVAPERIYTREHAWALEELWQRATVATALPA